MDNKNVFVAIALSMSVLLFGVLFLKLQENLLGLKQIIKLKRKLKKVQLPQQSVNQRSFLYFQEKSQYVKAID